MATETISRFSAKVSYALARGYGSSGTFKTATGVEAHGAIIEALKEIIWIAHLGGFADKALAETQAVVERAKGLQELADIDASLIGTERA